MGLFRKKTIFSIRCSFTQRNSMQQMPVFPVESVKRSVPPGISALKTVSLYGGKTVRTAWLASAAAPKRPLSMAGTAKDFPDILVPNSFFTVQLFPFRAILPVLRS